MKRILPLIAAGLLVTSCGPAADPAASPAASPAVVIDRPDADLSYAFGVSVGESLARTEVLLDHNAFLDGVKDSGAKKARITTEQAEALIRDAIVALHEAKGVKNAEASKKFLEDNKSKEGVKTTDSGLQYKVLTEGTGEKPGLNATVKVHYTGKLTDGTVFDSSVERGEPVEFPLQGVIPGWTEALQLMTVGSKYTLWIPAELAYGENGSRDGTIGPNQVLNFDVELLEITDKGEAAN